jgi:predicted Zn-dependent protease
MKSWYCFCAALLVLPAWADPAGNVGGLHTGQPAASFDNDRYQLGYQVYVASHNLAAACQVARKALHSRPDDPEWLRRFAQASEWIGQPEDALDAWLRLARLHDDQKAWAAVGRLAPGLLNDDALLAYQQNVVGQQGVSPALVKAIAATYERLGRPDEGLAFLDKLRVRNSADYLLDAEASLAERSGRDTQAVSLIEQLISADGPREAWLLRLVALDYTRGNQADALAALEAAAPRMPASAAGFWQTYAVVASQQGRDAEARKAYQTLVDSGKAGAADLMGYVSLLENQDALAAAHLSETAFRKFGDDSALITALYLYERENRTGEPAALLASLRPEQLARLERQPDFLEHRGHLEWRQKQLVQAHRDFELGLHLAPDNRELLQALVLLTIDQQDMQTLHELLQRYAFRARRTPALWPVWGSGWNLLEQPHDALPYLRSYAEANPDDNLARLHLADAYEKWGDSNTAATLRNQVIRATRGANGSDHTASPERMAELEEAMLALRLSQAAPDPGLLLLRSRLKRDASGKLDPTARELTLSWLLAHDNGARAQRWMARTYPEGAPAWARAELAQSTGDAAGMQQLLNDPRKPLPPAQEEAMSGELAAQMNWPRLEESSVFAALEQNADNEEGAQRFRELALAHASWVEARTNALQQGGLQRVLAGVGWSHSLGGSWRLEAGADHIGQGSLGAGELGKPTSGARGQLALRRESSTGSWLLAAGGTQLMKDYAFASVSQSYRPTSSLYLHWAADHDADAPESAALLAAGMKDQLSAGFDWAFTSHWFTGADLKGARFYSQARDYLGNGEEVDLELGRHFSLGRIPQTLKLTAADTHFVPDRRPLPADLIALVPAGVMPSSSFFIPVAYRQAAIYWDIGDASDNYENRWHAFGELGPVYANTTGKGYELRLGGAGPLLGHDRASLSLEQEKTGQSSGGVIKQLLAAYRYFY